MTNRIVKRGELYWLEWGAGRGSEQAGRRPSLILQENSGNSNPNYPMVIVAAITTTRRNVPFHITVAPTKENGLTEESFVVCQQLMTVDKARLGELIGQLDAITMMDVNEALAKVLGLI